MHPVERCSTLLTLCLVGNATVAIWNWPTAPQFIDVFLVFSFFTRSPYCWYGYIVTMEDTGLACSLVYFESAPSSRLGSVSTLLRHRPPIKMWACQRFEEKLYVKAKERNYRSWEDVALYKIGGGAAESNDISWLGGSPELRRVLLPWLESLLASEMWWDRPVKGFHVEGSQTCRAGPRVRGRIYFVV